MAAERLDQDTRMLLRALQTKLAQAVVRLDGGSAKWADVLAGLRLLCDVQLRGEEDAPPQADAAMPRLARLVPTAKRVDARAG